MSPKRFEKDIANAKRMQALSHRIPFAHGDLKHHNILFCNGHISGFVEWEPAGWYPEYWDFTTALRVCPTDFWWYSFVSQLGAEKYVREIEIEESIFFLTADSFPGDGYQFLESSLH